MKSTDLTEADAEKIVREVGKKSDGQMEYSCGCFMPSPATNLSAGLNELEMGARNWEMVEKEKVNGVESNEHNRIETSFERNVYRCHRCGEKVTGPLHKLNEEKVWSDFND